LTATGKYLPNNEYLTYFGLGVGVFAVASQVIGGTATVYTIERLRNIIIKSKVNETSENAYPVSIEEKASSNHNDLLGDQDKQLEQCNNLLDSLLEKFEDYDLNLPLDEKIKKLGELLATSNKKNTELEALATKASDSIQGRIQDYQKLKKLVRQYQLEDPKIQEAINQNINIQELIKGAKLAKLKMKSERSVSSHSSKPSDQSSGGTSQRSSPTSSVSSRISSKNN
jgi:hypothetical protein